MGVAVGGDDLHHVVADLEDGDVEGAAAKVVDRDHLVALLVEPIGERRGGRLVDDSLDVEPGDLAGVFGGLALCIVEVSGNGDDGLVDLLTDVIFRSLLQLLQNLGRHFRGRHFLAAHVEPSVTIFALHDFEGDPLHLVLHFLETAPHKALGGIDGVLGIGDRLALGDLAHVNLAFVVPGHDRRGQTRAFLVDDDFGVFAFHHRDHAVGRSEVDSNDLAHVGSPKGGSFGLAVDVDQSNAARRRQANHMSHGVNGVGTVCDGLRRGSRPIAPG
jgi:hypothetical protein